MDKFYITPIYKSGSKQDVSNYRPISILNHFSKILDSIVTEKLSDFLLISLNQEQRGFIKAKSTLTNLLIYTDFIPGALENGEQIDSIYLDFRKAFDSVNHCRLISKLFNLGVKRVLLSWISSYIKCRVDYINMSPFSVKSGVPQGSHLGPLLLFVAFINDTSSSITNCNL